MASRRTAWTDSSQTAGLAELPPPKPGTPAHMSPDACWGSSSTPEGVSAIGSGMDGKYLVEETWAGSECTIHIDGVCLLRLSPVIILSSPTPSSANRTAPP